MGWKLIASEDELFEFVTAVADGQMSLEQIASWIETHLVGI